MMSTESCQSLQGRLSTAAEMTKHGLLVAAEEAVAGLKTVRQRAVAAARSARAGTRRTFDEFPVETVAVVAVVAFAAGILMRVARSRRYA